MRSSLALLMVAVGCAPPPAVVGGPDTGVDGEPALEIVFPTPEMLEQPIPLSADCTLELVVAIDVDNFELIHPAETDGDADGQGHWHLQMSVPDRGYTAVFGQAGIIQEVDLLVGDLITVRGALQSNTHEELSEFTNFQSVIEFTVGAPDSGAGGAQCP